jgi:hypothetical protein
MTPLTSTPDPKNRSTDASDAPRAADTTGAAKSHPNTAGVLTDDAWRSYSSLEELIAARDLACFSQIFLRARHMRDVTRDSLTDRDIEHLIDRQELLTARFVEVVNKWMEEHDGGPVLDSFDHMALSIVLGGEMERIAELSPDEVLAAAKLGMELRFAAETLPFRSQRPAPRRKRRRR